MPNSPLIRSPEEEKAIQSTSFSTTFWAQLNTRIPFYWHTMDDSRDKFAKGQVGGYRCSSKNCFCKTQQLHAENERVLMQPRTHGSSACLCSLLARIGRDYDYYCRKAELSGKVSGQWWRRQENSEGWWLIRGFHLKLQYLYQFILKVIPFH